MRVNLTDEEKVIWDAWIVEIETTILADFSLTNDQKIVKISLSLEAFFKVNEGIHKKLAYEKIDNWGFMVDFVYVSISIQIEVTQSVVTLDDENTCGLIEALLNATANGSQDEQDACNSLVVEIQAILEDSSYTYEQKMAIIAKIFKAFFADHPDMEEFFLSINIKGYGSVKSLLRVCRVYEQITTLSVVIGGSDETDCVLIAALDAASKNVSMEKQYQILQLKAKIKAFFKNTTSLKLRLQYVSAQCYQMFKLEAWMIQTIEEISCGEWGNVYDLIFCSGVCTNHGCGNPDNGPGPQGTTASPTSTQASVTPADCSTCGSLIVVDSKNETHLTNCLLKAYGNFTNSQKFGFNSCFNKVRRAIWDNVSFPTQASKLAELHSDFLQYNNNSAVNQQLVFNLTITIWHGTIGEFVKCTA